MNTPLTRFAVDHKSGLYGPFVSHDGAFIFAERLGGKYRIRTQITPQPDQRTRPIQGERQWNM